MANNIYNNFFIIIAFYLIVFKAIRLFHLACRQWWLDIYKITAIAATTSHRSIAAVFTVELVVLSIEEILS